MVHILPGWLQLVFFVYWVVAVVLLIMDDREPSITLAWLFILLFLPFIGMVFYIFFGRDWKVVAQRKGWIQTLRQVEAREMAPVWERNAGASQRFLREWTGTIAVPIKRAITSENLAALLPASSIELFNDAPTSSAGSRRTWPAPGASSTCSTSSGSRTGSRPRSCRSCSTAPGGRRGPHHVRLDGVHHVQEGGAHVS